MAAEKTLDGFMRVSHLIYTLESAKAKAAEKMGEVPDVLQINQEMAAQLRQMMLTWPGVFKDFSAEGHRQPASFDGLANGALFIGNICGMDIFEMEPEQEMATFRELEVRHGESMAKVRLAH